MSAVVVIVLLLLCLAGAVYLVHLGAPRTGATIAVLVLLVVVLLWVGTLVGLSI